uniref:hypothetical protein n=1 Tax=Pulvinaster venetus TaxID=427767 RepID=UPI001FCDDAC8|nr:hypothetical protein MW436_pgp137 [Pulvinaster venetus]UNJ16922.1 hypothetical protein [Pulvinaster venetus]
MSSSPKICPVPIDQQPLEEYKNLLNSYFFAIPSYRYSQFLNFLLIIWIFSLFFSLPIAFYTFSLLQNPIHFVALSFLLPDLIIIIILLNLYLAWSYVIQRLLNSIIFYEESGWHDGQLWIKTSEMLIKDRLVAMNQGIPLLNKIKIVFAVFSVKVILISFVLLV